MYYVESSGTPGTFVIRDGKLITEYEPLEDGAYKIIIYGGEQNVIVKDGKMISN